MSRDVIIALGLLIACLLLVAFTNNAITGAVTVKTDTTTKTDATALKTDTKTDTKSSSIFSKLFSSKSEETTETEEEPAAEPVATPSVAAVDIVASLPEIAVIKSYTDLTPDEDSSVGCSRTMSERLNEMNDRLSDLENQQTAIGCREDTDIKAGCDVRIIPDYIPTADWSCDDTCEDDAQDPRACLFGFSTMVNQETRSGLNTEAKIVPCDEPRGWIEYATIIGEVREKTVMCVCC